MAQTTIQNRWQKWNKRSFKRYTSWTLARFKRKQKSLNGSQIMPQIKRAIPFNIGIQCFTSVYISTMMTKDRDKSWWLWMMNLQTNRVSMKISHKYHKITYIQFFFKSWTIKLFRKTLLKKLQTSTMQCIGLTDSIDLNVESYKLH